MNSKIKKPIILVTGGAGFIGSNFILSYINKSIIINLDKLTYAGSLDSLHKIENNNNYHFVEGDISDNKLIKDVINEYKPTYIINFAAESHVDRSIEDPFIFINTNIVGVANLLIESTEYYGKLSDEAKSKFRFLHISTDEVYGSLDINDDRFTEKTKYAPSSPYSASKASSDHLVNAWNRTYQLPTLITNCSNNYGPYQFPEKLIPHMIINCLLENKLPIYGDGKNIRDWLYVKDHCEAIYNLLVKGQPGTTYNIGGDSESSNYDIVSMICTKMDLIVPRKNNKSYNELIEFVPDRPGHDFRYAVDISKIQKELNWNPKCDFENGINKTIHWYVENKEWWKNKINNKYKISRLGVIK